MGQRGPAKTPLAIMEARGSPHVTKKRKAREPKPPAGEPTCPKWMSKDAKAVWKAARPILSTMGVLTTADGNTLARYCTMFVRWKRAEAALEQHGQIFETIDQQGNVSYKTRPEVRIASDLAAGMLAIEKQFGLTPSARASLSAVVPIGSGDEKADNPTLKFVKGA